MEICHRSDTDTTKNGEPSLEWGDEVWMTRKRRCTHAATAKPQTRHTATTIQLCNYQSKLSNGVKVNVKKGKVQTYTYILYAEFCLVHLYELLTATSSNFPSRHHYWSPLPSATIFHMRVTTHENHVAHHHGDFDPHVNLAMTTRRAWTPECSGVIHFTLEAPCRTSPLIQVKIWWDQHGITKGNEWRRMFLPIVLTSEMFLQCGADRRLDWRTRWTGYSIEPKKCTGFHLQHKILSVIMANSY